MQFWLVLLFLLVAGARTIASSVIDYQWWKEVGHVQTWINMAIYGFAPMLTAAVLTGVLLWIALARGLKHGGEGFGAMPRVARLATLGALLLGLAIASSTIDSWTVVRYLGGRNLGPDVTPWKDPVFGKPLAFYLFDLPFLRGLLAWAMASLAVAAIVNLAASRMQGIRAQLPNMRQGGEVDLGALRLTDGAAAPLFARLAGAGFLLALAARYFLGRYGLTMSDHGFMVGIDYVDETYRLPLMWMFLAVCVAAAGFAAMGKWKLILLLPLVRILEVGVPMAMNAIYVRPNEIQLQKPYIARHIEATRAAFGLDKRVKEREFATQGEVKIDPARHKPLLDNVRLWDWRAFHDTVTQIQALRPYYVFNDTDVDRYVIDGKLRQVMLTPRELDIRQLPDAQTRWINPHFIYTHGYGMVMAESNRITPDGLPLLFVQDAPPQVKTNSLKLTQPEIYFGEVMHEPVFVRTGQKEFSYPAGNESVFTRYDGKGGFPIDSFGLRLAAALREGDFNILLTNQFSMDSRMMIRRQVRERLQAVAGFLHWDTDPYLVVTDAGRLVWTADAYTTSDSHPYAANIALDGERANYIRNPVKATVDAYHGTIHLYVFDPADPIIKAYQSLFPGLLEPASAMPADVRKHARYPELFFRAQAEIYRTYHMRDPQTFYNKEDVWDVARNAYGRDARRQLTPPAYVVATLPGEQEAEFLLTLPFTPRTKDNLIGLMMARCDGDKLGELEFLQLSRQALVFGPMQIEARIDQDPEISKDLSLWNQKGSEVLRGQMLVLPIDNSFLYVEPIYIQAQQARMPQLQKVVVAMGNDLAYRNTYEEALAALGGFRTPSAAVTAAAGGPAAAGAGGPSSQPAPGADSDRRLGEIRQRLRRYRELWGQGKYAEAGRELEQLETLVNQR